MVLGCIQFQQHLTSLTLNRKRELQKLAIGKNDTFNTGQVYTTYMFTTPFSTPSAATRRAPLPQCIFASAWAQQPAHHRDLAINYNRPTVLGSLVLEFPTRQQGGGIFTTQTAEKHHLLKGQSEIAKTRAQI